MRITQINAAYQLTYFKNESLSVNCYFVEEDDGLTLIDAAIEECFEGIVKAAAEIGKPIRRIVLTHGHHDHVGALYPLSEMFPKIMVHVSAREARILTGDRTLDPDEPDTSIRGNIPTNVKTRTDVCLQEGDRIGSLLCLATPGHTPGSMSFLDTRNQVIYAGDAFQITGGIAVAGQLRSSFPYPALGTWNTEVSVKSARKLLHCQPSLLAVGHGDVLEQPYTHMELAITEAERNIANEPTNSHLTNRFSPR